MQMFMCLLRGKPCMNRCMLLPRVRMVQTCTNAYIEIGHKSGNYTINFSWNILKLLLCLCNQKQTCFHMVVYDRYKDPSLKIIYQYNSCMPTVQTIHACSFAIAPVQNRLARCRNCLPFQCAFIHKQTYFLCRCCSLTFNVQCNVFIGLSSIVSLCLSLTLSLQYPSSFSLWFFQYFTSCIK